MRKKIFYLAGFMASGKSTIGPILANTVGWNFFDLDDEIEKRENSKIVKIFEENGEKYFRKRETEVLRELSKGEKIIISLGGGTLVNPKNRKIINNSGNLIFLRSSSDVLYQRLKHKRDRPVLLSGDEEEKIEITLMQKIESLMSERMKYYKKADFIFDTDKDSIGNTVNKIAKLIEKSYS